MVKRKAGICGEVRGEAVSEDDDQTTTPGGAGERPDGITAGGQVSILRLVTARSEPGLSQKENVYVVDGNEG